MPKVIPEYRAKQVMPTMTMPTTVSTSENALWWRFRAAPIQSPAEVVFILFRPPAVASDIPRTGHPPLIGRFAFPLRHLRFAICDYSVQPRISQSGAAATEDEGR
ncbi:MAG: hypothetical protein DME25_18910 [Verrucomicrobia bacterium]|nr:MAG: hypothetical protein DME25_18910 [Verrucomicrobiota bacterium]